MWYSYVFLLEIENVEIHFLSFSLNFDFIFMISQNFIGYHFLNTIETQK